MIDKECWRERLSSCMDGELKDIDSFMDQVAEDKDAQSCWHRYHLIRDIMRDNQASRVPMDFSLKVMQRIEKEPTVFAPPKNTHRILPNFLNKNILKPIAGLAIAASVAAVTVISLQSFQSTPENVPNAFTAKTLDSGGLSTAAQNFSPVTPNYSPDIFPAEASISEEINAYIIDHMEHSSVGNSQRILPYVQVSGSKNDR